MSHSPQRKEKDCLNCGAIVQGHYCQECGQENIEPKETFWHMVTHFFYDITHFDGSFFVTIKDLLLKPGFLTKEYMNGRRKMYLHPIRMYVFTSAVFFLVFYSLFSMKETGATDDKLPIVQKLQVDGLSKAKTKEDSAEIYNVIAMLSKSKDSLTKDTVLRKEKRYQGQGINFSLERGVEDYKSVREYDSVQKNLPDSERDNWFEQMLTHRAIVINAKYKGDQTTIGLKIWDKFMHSFPYLLFVSLPLYALFLKLLYFRRKQFYYADHGVFLIHLYIFTFLLLMLFFSIDEIQSATHWRWLDILNSVLLLTGVFYMLKAMKNFYKQSWGKTILKFIIFNILCLVALTFLFAGFMFLSFYQV